MARALLDRLAEMTLGYLEAQVEAGAQVVQLFDTWAGLLSEAEYREWLLPGIRRTDEVVYNVLCAIPRGRFCEWGSGMGVVTGLAETLGFNAYGIEINADLAAAADQFSAEAAGEDVPLPRAVRRSRPSRLHPRPTQRQWGLKPRTPAIVSIVIALCGISLLVSLVLVATAK